MKRENTETSTRQKEGVWREKRGGYNPTTTKRQWTNEEVVLAGSPWRERWLGRFGAYNHASWLVPSAQWSSRLSNASLPCALVLLSSPCSSRFLRTRNLIIFLARDRLPGGLLKTFLRVTIFFPRLYFETCSRNNVIFFFFFFDRRSVNYYYYYYIYIEISQSRIKHLNNFDLWRMKKLNKFLAFLSGSSIRYCLYSWDSTKIVPSC